MGYKMDICQVAALRIRKMRLEKNMTIDDLAEKCDVSTHPESTVVGNLISELTTEEVIYLVSILSRYVEILKKAGTDRNENSSV